MTENTLNPESPPAGDVQLGSLVEKLTHAKMNFPIGADRDQLIGHIDYLAAVIDMSVINNPSVHTACRKMLGRLRDIID